MKNNRPFFQEIRGKQRDKAAAWGQEKKLKEWKRSKDRQNPRLPARNPLTEGVNSVCGNGYSLLYKSFGLCSSFAILRATAFTDTSAGGYLGGLCSRTEEPTCLKALVLLSPAKAASRDQGETRWWGKLRKRKTLPATSSTLKLSLVSKRLQHWKTTVRESVTFLALKMLVRTEERTGQTLSHGSPSPQSKGKWIQAGKSALQLPRIAEVSYLFATHLYRLYWWAVSCSEVPPCLKCMRF